MRGFVDLFDNQRMTEYIHDSRSLVDLIDKHMGADVAKSVQKIVNERDDLKLEVETEMDSELRSYEFSLESNLSTFNQIMELVENELDYLNETERMNKDRLIATFRDILNKINNEI